jgi:hypothetical protein
MKYWLKTTYLVLFILLSSFQCSIWAKYAEDIRLDVNPDKLSSVSDSVSVLVQASIQEELSEKIDSVKISIYYLPGDNYLDNPDKKIGAIFLTSAEQSQSKKFKFKFVEGRNLYAKQVVRKNKKRIESPLLLIAEQ